MNWKYFVGACIVVGAALLKAGAPLITVLGGIAAVAFLNYWRHRGTTTPAGRLKAR